MTFGLGIMMKAGLSPDTKQRTLKAYAEKWMLFQAPAGDPVTSSDKIISYRLNIKN